MTVSMPINIYMAKPVPKFLKSIKQLNHSLIKKISILVILSKTVSDIFIRTFPVQDCFS